MPVPTRFFVKKWNEAAKLDSAKRFTRVCRRCDALSVDLASYCGFCGDVLAHIETQQIEQEKGGEPIGQGNHKHP